MWSLEDIGYSRSELSDIFHQSTGLKSAHFEAAPTHTPGVVSYEITTSGGYISFCIDHGQQYSFDAALLVHGERYTGTGRTLVEAREDFCRSVGVDYIVLTKPMPHAQGFWEKMGYENNMKWL